ncbi:MAG: DUF305 domain-containing protein [Clostridium butyricum]|nr:DUF305 domain-containing protein [Clostridium butyricum]
MKIIIRSLVLFTLSILLGLSASIGAFAESKEKKVEYSNSHKEIIKSLKECENACTTYTEDITVDFLNQFIYANKIKIGLSENLIKFGENKDVRNASKKCIHNSMENINNVEPILDCIKDNLTKDKNKEEKYLKEYLNIYNEMIEELEKQCDEEIVDRAFLKSIICHGKFTIKMIDNIEKYNEDKGIIKLCRNARKEQIKEINKMEKLLDEIE